MTNSVTVEGADTLARTAKAAGRELQDMSGAGEKTGTLISNRSRVEAPRLTGALAASVSTRTKDNETEIFSGLAYANRTHWGFARYHQAAQPFIWDPAQQLEGTWERFYADEADKILDGVKGA